MRVLGFTAKSNLEDAKLDMIGDVIGEAWNSSGISDWPAVLLGRTPVADKADHFKTIVRPRLEPYAALFEKFLVENGANDLLCGDQVAFYELIIIILCFSKEKQ